jgi:carboxyl-terminal processing protease
MSTRSPSWPYFLAGLVTALLLFTLGAAAALTWQRLHPAAQTADPGPLYRQAWDIITQDYLGDLPSPAARTHGAIRGSLAAIGDPYTFFVEPEPAQRQQEELEGQFGGIGAHLELSDDGRIRLRPMLERPAALAGLLDGDLLIAIDGQPISALAADPAARLDAAANLLRGPLGSPVRITIQRRQATLDLTITRAVIELPSLSWRPLDQAPAIGYIRIERFSALTGKELHQALDELQAANAANRLILDLRGNPGGLLEAGVDVAAAFLDRDLILSEHTAAGNRKHYRAPTRGRASAAHITILIDHGTASAAEIVAAALQDHTRARLIGETTYGKGSVQRVHRLADDSAIHVTYARWYTPAGRQLDGHGLTPDLPVPPANGRDAPLQAAIDLLTRE